MKNFDPLRLFSDPPSLALVERATAYLRGSAEDVDVHGFLTVALDAVQLQGSESLAERAAALLGLPTLLSCSGDYLSRDYKAASPMSQPLRSDIPVDLDSNAFANWLVTTWVDASVVVKGPDCDNMDTLRGDATDLLRTGCLVTVERGKGVATVLVDAARKVNEMDALAIAFLRKVLSSLVPASDYVYSGLSQIVAQAASMVTQGRWVGPQPSSVCGIRLDAVQLALEQVNAGLYAVVRLVREFHRPSFLASM